MTTFHLPDLGKGIPEAKVLKWLVEPGDEVSKGVSLVEMTVKAPLMKIPIGAVVEVPAPFTGRVSHFHGAKGDIIQPGDPLVTFF